MSFATRENPPPKQQPLEKRMVEFEIENRIKYLIATPSVNKITARYFHEQVINARRKMNNAGRKLPRKLNNFLV